MQSSRKDPERIPLDLGNTTISVFITQRFGAVHCRHVLKRVVRHQVRNWLFMFSGSTTLTFFFFPCRTLSDFTSVVKPSGDANL